VRGGSPAEKILRAGALRSQFVSPRRMPAVAVSKIRGAAFEHESASFLLASRIREAERHKVLQFAGSAARSGAWLWRMHLPPQSEWANARAHTALCAALSSSERDRRSCAITVVVVHATHTVALNKDTGLSGRGRHTVVVRRAQQRAIAQYLPGASAVGSLWVDRASLGWLACLL